MFGVLIWFIEGCFLWCCLVVCCWFVLVVFMVVTYFMGFCFVGFVLVLWLFVCLEIWVWWLDWVCMGVVIVFLFLGLVFSLITIVVGCGFWGGLWVCGVGDG